MPPRDFLGRISISGEGGRERWKGEERERERTRDSLAYIYASGLVSEFLLLGDIISK